MQIPMTVHVKTFLCALDVVTLELDDSYGDGWNATFTTINGVDYSVPDADGDYTTTTNFTVWMDGPVYLDVCIDLSVCNEVTYNATGSYQTEKLMGRLFRW